MIGIYHTTYKGKNRNSMLLSSITDLAKDPNLTPEQRLDQIDSCVADYWKKTLVRKVLDARSAAGMQGSFHFDDKMKLKMLLEGCWKTSNLITPYLNAMTELEEFITDTLGKEEVERMLEGDNDDDIY